MVPSASVEPDPSYVHVKPEQETEMTACGRITIGTEIVVVPSSPSLSTTANVTEYVPAEGNEWLIVLPVPDPPSLKVHEYPTICPQLSQEPVPLNEHVRPVHE